LTFTFVRHGLKLQVSRYERAVNRTVSVLAVSLCPHQSLQIYECNIIITEM